MRRTLPGFALLTLVTLALAPARPQAQSVQDLRLTRFTEYLESLRVQAGIPGLAAAIIGTDAIVWEFAFGRQNLERAIATRTDTPFHLNGLTQVITSSLVLRCVEEGHLSLDEPVGPEGQAPTIRQILTHTDASPDAVFTYDPERIDLVAPAVEACTGKPFRRSFTDLLERLAMFESIPGSDIVEPDHDRDGNEVDRADLERYERLLERLATSYAVDARGRPTPLAHTPTPLTPGDGLISTVLDYADFDLALKRGLLLRTGTLADAWRVPVGRDGERRPHAVGWFVQPYRDEAVVWQFGVGENAASSLVVMVPSRGLTLVLLANSSGLASAFDLEKGDLTASPFGRLFLELFVR